MSNVNEQRNISSQMVLKQTTIRSQMSEIYI
jgi:hypothetical protein